MVDMSFAYKSGGNSRSRTSFYRIGFDTIRNKIKNGCKIRRLFIIYSHYCTALQERIRRNDPCPCNSNKKYKDCHMRSIFNPRERFQVIVHNGNVAQNFHMERKVGTDEWVRKPGRMAMRIGYLEKVYPDIDDLITLLTEEIPDNRYILKQQANRLKHKMYGIRYHLKNFAEQEDKKISIQFALPGT